MLCILCNTAFMAIEYHGQPDSLTDVLTGGNYVSNRTIRIDSHYSGSFPLISKKRTNANIYIPLYILSTYHLDKDCLLVLQSFLGSIGFLIFCGYSS